ncbi:MAG: pyridoxamine 5'-phosphate oxidase family protein [Clostridia bacterium]|nr:pyridoxamine 5'-phosphate oxidase family protein [Clostridia bacterium]
MFAKMRRFKQQLSREEIERILLVNTSGVLALIDGDGYPYSVPLSYVYSDGKIYFHSAKSGHKIDAVNNCKKATFCIIDKDDIKPEKYTTFYKSVIAFGKVEIVGDSSEALYAIRQLGQKYYPDHNIELRAEIEKYNCAFSIIRFDIEHITGKQAVEFIKK